MLLENVVTVESLAAFWTRVGSIKKKRELGDRNYTYREVWGIPSVISQELSYDNFGP